MAKRWQCKRIRIRNIIILFIFVSFSVQVKLTHRSYPSKNKTTKTNPSWASTSHLSQSRDDLRHPTISSTTTVNDHVTFVNNQDMRENDISSAVWWIRRERFLDTSVQDIVGVERDVFLPILSTGQGRKDVRMTHDWLDFSVEHMSPWQKLIGTTNPGNSLVANIMQRYVKQHEPTSLAPLDDYMNTTLAVIPFGVNDETSMKVQQVWTTFLMATITSLLGHGIRRVVVVGYYRMDAILTLRVFSYFAKQQNNTLSSVNMTLESLPFQTFKIQATDLAYVQTSDVVTNNGAVNVPRGALIGLQQELQAQTKVSHKSDSNDTGAKDSRNSYLGPNHQAIDFEYVFLTEADQILHARLSPVFLQELQQNHVLIPHRLQPIPHAKDLEPIVKPGSLKQLPNHHPPIIDLNNSRISDACCDSPAPNNYGDGEEATPCGSFRWMCAYEHKSWNFSYLDKFDFIQLSSAGTGVVLLAGNAHGRRCIVKPSGRGTCGN